MPFRGLVGGAVWGSLAWWVVLVRTFWGVRCAVPRSGRSAEFKEPIIRLGCGLGRCAILSRRARSCACACILRALSWSGCVEEEG